MVKDSKEFDDHRQLVQKHPGSIHKVKQQAVDRAWGDEAMYVLHCDLVPI